MDSCKIASILHLCYFHCIPMYLLILSKMFFYQKQFTSCMKNKSSTTNIKKLKLYIFYTYFSKGLKSWSRNLNQNCITHTYSNWLLITHSEYWILLEKALLKILNWDRCYHIGHSLCFIYDSPSGGSIWTYWAALTKRSQMKLNIMSSLFNKLKKDAI